jgi:sigma-B regulation protein RsbU (phosphoserine phosphatase)
MYRKGGEMEKQLFERIAHNLKEQHRNVVGWLRNAPREKRAVHLGNQPDAAAQEHLKVLEDAIGKAESEELGRCTVCHDYVEPHWLETNFSNCVCLEHLTGEERSRLEAELELSQKVQKALLPQTLPPLPGWGLAAFSQPASIVGGDYFDFLRFRDGAHAILIADVMGKGMPASMLMASLQASLRIIIPESDSPGQVLSRANQLFHHNVNLTKFVSIVVAHLDPETGVILYANAGHNPPLLIRKRVNGPQEPLPLRPTGAAIGLVEDAHFHVDTVHVSPGEMLVFYTDGLIEAVNGLHEEFGEERLKNFLVSKSQNSPAEVIRDLRSELKQFVGDRPLMDDTTILVCKRTG